MTSPLCSVVMSVRDEDPDFLRCSVGSILAQSFRNFEFILIDDGSSNTACLESLDEISGWDQRLVFYRREKSGLSESLNFAISKARGPIIIRQDSDDWSSQDRVMRLADHLNAHPDLVLVGSFWRAYNSRTQPLWDVKLPVSYTDIVGSLPHCNPFCHGSVAFRRETFIQLGGYRAQCVRSQDYDLFWRLAESGRAENLPRYLYHRRYSANSVSCKDSEGQLIATRAIRALAQMRAAQSPENIREAFEQAAASMTDEDRVRCSLIKADMVLLAGHSKEALGLFLRIICQNPSLHTFCKLGRGLLISLLGRRWIRFFFG